MTQCSTKVDVQFDSVFTMLHKAISKIPFSQKQQPLDQHKIVVRMNRSLMPRFLLET